jgi:sporulation protein YlmC with PRC-barrel domain
MRISELIGRPVHDADGEPVGQIADVRLTQDGPMLGRIQRAFAVDGLIVVPRHTGQLFGYERVVADHGPWLVRSIIRWLHRDSVFASWDQVADLGGNRVRLKVTRDELTPLRRLAERV